MSYSSSDVLAWCGMGLLMLGALVTELHRLNDPDEHLFPLRCHAWKHIRAGLPWIWAGVGVLLAVGVAKLL